MQIELNKMQLENEILKQELNKILLHISEKEARLLEGPIRAKHI